MFACIYAPHLPESSYALLVNCASGFSPRIEETGPQTVVMDMAGMEHLLGPPQQMAQALVQRAAGLGIRANVALASNPDAAIHAARGIAGVTVIPQGEEARALAGLPIALLGAAPETESTLRCWGLRFFRDVAALPEAGISERLGPEGLLLLEKTRGIVKRQLRPSLSAASFEQSLELEHAVALLDPLLFLLARLLNDLLQQLALPGLATNELRLCLRLENGTEHKRTLRLPFPMRHSKPLLKLLHLDLEAHPPAAPVLAIVLSAAATDPRVVQYGLFLPPAPEPEKLELTLGRMKKLAGEQNVGSPELLDSYRPQAFRMKRFIAEQAASHSRRRSKASVQSSDPKFCNGVFLVLRPFRPPRRANVEAASGRPLRLSAGGLRGQVISSAGPWRSSGDWWEPDAWSHDEWDVALQNGALYRIFLDRLSGVWFVEGAYD